MREHLDLHLFKWTDKVTEEHYYNYKHIYYYYVGFGPPCRWIEEEGYGSLNFYNKFLNCFAYDKILKFNEVA